MATIGKLLDRPEAKHYMDYYFNQMRETSDKVCKRPYTLNPRPFLNPNPSTLNNHPKP